MLSNHDLETQVGFWNNWNAGTREDTIQDVSADQAKGSSTAGCSGSSERTLKSLKQDAAQAGCAKVCSAMATSSEQISPMKSLLAGSSKCRT